MASMMMRDDKPLSPNAILQFYYKRVRRLVPLYLVNTLTVWSLSQIFVYPGDNEGMIKHIKWALAYASNIYTTMELNGYFVSCTHVYVLALYKTRYKYWNASVTVAIC